MIPLLVLSAAGYFVLMLVVIYRHKQETQKIEYLATLARGQKS